MIKCYFLSIKLIKRKIILEASRVAVIQALLYTRAAGKIMYGDIPVGPLQEELTLTSITMQ